MKMNDASRTSAADIVVKVQPVSPLIPDVIPLPQSATAGSAGIDLAACLKEPVRLAPGERRLIPTGLAIELPGADVGAFLFARSGLAAKSGIHLANGVGVIDSDYRGEIKVALVNGGEEEFVVHPGDRIAQLLFLPVLTARLVVAENLSETDRGQGGFGHSGIR